MELSVPDFGLAQLWLLWAFGEENQPTVKQKQTAILFQIKNENINNHTKEGLGNSAQQLTGWLGCSRLLT